MASLFTLEGNASATIALSGSQITFEVPSKNSTITSGVIVSEKIAGAWNHNQCVLGGDKNADFVADAALPTYPTGAQKFLNGGDL